MERTVRVPHHFLGFKALIFRFIGSIERVVECQLLLFHSQWTGEYMCGESKAGSAFFRVLLSLAFLEYDGVPGTMGGSIGYSMEYVPIGALLIQWQ